MGCQLLPSLSILVLVHIVSSWTRRVYSRYPSSLVGKFQVLVSFVASSVGFSVRFVTLVGLLIAALFSLE